MSSSEVAGGIAAGSLVENAAGEHWLRGVLRHRAAAVGALVLGGLILMAVLAPVLAPYGLHERVGVPFDRPSWAHLLGLDDAGHDVLTVLLWGARTSLAVGVAASVISILIGGVVGVVSGYRGGRVDTLLMRVTDYVFVIPTVPLLIAIASVTGPSVVGGTMMIGLLLWPVTARVVRSQVKSLRERQFVQRTRSLGAGNTRIIHRHIVPHIAPLLIANAVVTVASAIFFHAALEFLGLGDPTSTSWGGMIENAFQRAAVSVNAWWALAPPGVCIALTIVACSLIGQVAEETLNPRLRTNHLSRRSFATTVGSNP